MSDKFPCILYHKTCIKGRRFDFPEDVPGPDWMRSPALIGYDTDGNPIALPILTDEPVVQPTPLPSWEEEDGKIPPSFDLIKKEPEPEKRKPGRPPKWR